MQALLPRLAGGSIPAELVAATAATSIFTLVCVLCGWCMGGATGKPPAHLPPPAWEPGWSGTSKGCSGSRCTFCRSLAASLVTFL